MRGSTAIACADGELFPDPDAEDARIGLRPSLTEDDKHLAAAFNLATSPLRGSPKPREGPALAKTSQGPPVFAAAEQSSPMVYSPRVPSMPISLAPFDSHLGEEQGDHGDDDDDDADDDHEREVVVRHPGSSVGFLNKISDWWKRGKSGDMEDLLEPEPEPELREDMEQLRIRLSSVLTVVAPSISVPVTPVESGSDEGDGQAIAATEDVTLASGRDSFHSVDEAFGDRTPSPKEHFDSPHAELSAPGGNAASALGDAASGGGSSLPSSMPKPPSLQLTSVPPQLGTTTSPGRPDFRSPEAPSPLSIAVEQPPDTRSVTARHSLAEEEPATTGTKELGADVLPDETDPSLGEVLATPPSPVGKTRLGTRKIVVKRLERFETAPQFPDMPESELETMKPEVQLSADGTSTMRSDSSGCSRRAQRDGESAGEGSAPALPDGAAAVQLVADPGTETAKDQKTAAGGACSRGKGREDTSNSVVARDQTDENAASLAASTPKKSGACSRGNGRQVDDATGVASAGDAAGGAAVEATSTPEKKGGACSRGTGREDTGDLLLDGDGLTAKGSTKPGGGKCSRGAGREEDLAAALQAGALAPDQLVPRSVKVFDAGDSWKAFCVRGAEWSVELGQEWIWNPKPHQKGQRPLVLDDQMPGRGASGWFVVKVYYSGPSTTKTARVVETTPFTLPATLHLGLDGRVVVKPGAGGRIWDEHIAKLQSSHIQPQLVGSRQHLELPQLEFADQDLEENGEDWAAQDFSTPIVSGPYSQGQLVQTVQEQEKEDLGSRGEEDVFGQGSGGDPLFDSPQRQPQQTRSGQAFDPNFFLSDHGLQEAAEMESSGGGIDGQMVSPLRKSGSQPIAIEGAGLSGSDSQKFPESSPDVIGVADTNAVVSQQLLMQSGLSLPPIIAGGTPREETPGGFSGGDPLICLPAKPPATEGSLVEGADYTVEPINLSTTPTSVSAEADYGSQNSLISPTGSVTSAAWGGSWMDEDFGDEDFAAGAGLDLDEEDEMLAMALAPGMRASRSMSIGGGEDDRLALNMLESKTDTDGAKKPRRPRADSTKRTPKIRVYGISDLHADFTENMEWLTDLPKDEYKNDVLCVAGDISDHIEIVEKVWEILVPRFHRVFFVPGNHDLWTTSDYDDSIKKWKANIELCRKYGVRTSPELVMGQVWVVPLLSWYCDMVEKGGGQQTDLVPLQGWMDFTSCKWPATVVKPLSTVAAAAEEANRKKAAQVSGGGAGAGMRRIGSKTWLPVEEPETEMSSSPRSVSVRAKMKDKLWMSEAVDAYFLRQNDEMLEKMLPKVSSRSRADYGAHTYPTLH